MNANHQPTNHPGRISVAVMLCIGVGVTAFTWAKPKDDHPGLGLGLKDAVADAANAITGLTIGGSELAPAYYHLTEDVDLGDITFTGPTVIVADGDITVSGNPVITATGEVTIYFAGDFTMSGTASINNEGRPRNLKLYATREYDEETMTDANRQQIVMNGNVDFSGVIYAPEAKFTSNGGGGQGATYGAVLAYNATYNGVPGPFHYDESLANEVLPDQPFSTSGYRPIRDPDTQLVNNDPNLGVYNDFIDSFFSSGS